MLSKKTLASTGQLLTLAGRFTAQISQVQMDSETAQFWIDHPEITSRRLSKFCERPTVVQVITATGSMNSPLATRIKDWLGRDFDIFVYDSNYSRAVRAENMWIQPLADVVAVSYDRSLYHTVFDKVRANTRSGQIEILYVTDSDPYQKGVHVCKDEHNAIKWLAEREIEKQASRMKEQLVRLTPLC